MICLPFDFDETCACTRTFVPSYEQIIANHHINIRRKKWKKIIPRYYILLFRQNETVVHLDNGNTVRIGKYIMKGGIGGAFMLNPVFMNFKALHFDRFPYIYIYKVFPF